MKAIIKLEKTDLGMYGELYEIHVIVPYEHSNKSFRFKISEHDFERFKPEFTECEKSGQFNNDEIYS